jgi:hypothetical protein
MKKMKRKAAVTTLLLFLTSVNSFSTVGKAKSITQSTPLFQQPKKSHNHHGRRSSFGYYKGSSTETKLSAVPAVGAFAGALTGGLFAGGLHAIAGKLDRRNSCFSPKQLRRTDFHVAVAKNVNLKCDHDMMMVEFFL